jgi:Gamma-glutamyltranspeptidase
VPSVAARAEGRGIDPTSELLHPSYSLPTEEYWAHDPPTEKQLPRSLGKSFTRESDRFRDFPASRELFVTASCDAPPVGSTVCNPDLADAYGLIADQGVDALYGGAIGDAVVGACQTTAIEGLVEQPAADEPLELVEVVEGSCRRRAR